MPPSQYSSILFVVIFFLSFDDPYILFVRCFIPHNIRIHNGKSTQDWKDNFCDHHGESSPFCLQASSRDTPKDDEEEDILLQDEDWRDFRAKLVMNEMKTSLELSSPSSSAATDTSSTSTGGNGAGAAQQGSAQDEIIIDDGDLDGIGSLFRDEFVTKNAKESKESLDIAEMTPLDPSQWAYDCRDVIETGAVILGGVEQAFGFGLRQQYFHKAAILVLDHSDTFTKGIILNRPTDLTLEDDINTGVKWRVWFGGDVEGLNARHPDIVCLHSLKNEKATKASIPIMKDIQWTTFENAKKLVKSGSAQVSDFWVFVGYAGWGPGQLKGELRRNSWYMVATDSGTLLKELGRQTEGADPRDAGLDTWILLMNMIGRKDIAKEYSGGFDDLALKEWAFKNLLSTAAGGGAGRQQRDPDEFNTNPELVEHLLSLLESRSDAPMEGSLVRASSADRSPFLLQNQELHKSVILILKDEKAATVGVILNRPSSQGLDVKVDNKKLGEKKVERIPMMYGGQYSVEGEPVLWLHYSSALRAAKIGNPVADHQPDGIWMCTSQDVMKSVANGIAAAEQFLAVIGVHVWPKDEGTRQGIEGEIELGQFEMIPVSAREDVWSTLTKQQILTPVNLDASLQLSEEAWTAGAKKGIDQTKNGKKLDREIPLVGIGENFDEEDDSVVFKTDCKVSKLSDDALRNWCTVFLLGIPDYNSR